MPAVQMTEALWHKFHLCCPSLNSEAKSFERKREQVVRMIWKQSHGFSLRERLAGFYPCSEKNKYLHFAWEKAEEKLWKQSHEWGTHEAGGCFASGVRTAAGFKCLMCWPSSASLCKTQVLGRGGSNEHNLNSNHFSSPGRAWVQVLFIEGVCFRVTEPKSKFHFIGNLLPELPCSQYLLVLLGSFFSLYGPVYLALSGESYSNFIQLELSSSKINIS